MRRPARATLVTISPRVQVNSHFEVGGVLGAGEVAPAGGALRLTAEVVADDGDRAVLDIDVGQLRVFFVQDQAA